MSTPTRPSTGPPSRPVIEAFAQPVSQTDAPASAQEIEELSSALDLLTGNAFGPSDPVPAAGGRGGGMDTLLERGISESRALARGLPAPQSTVRGTHTIPEDGDVSDEEYTVAPSQTTETSAEDAVFTPESSSVLSILHHGESITQYDAFVFGCIGPIADYQVLNTSMTTVNEVTENDGSGENIVTESPGQPGVRFMFYILLWFLYDLNDTVGDKQGSLRLKANLKKHRDEITAIGIAGGAEKAAAVLAAMNNANSMIAELVNAVGKPSVIIQSMMDSRPEAFDELLNVRVNFRMVTRNDGQWFLAPVEEEDKEKWPKWSDLCMHWAKPLNVALIIAKRSVTLVERREATTGIGSASRSTPQKISLLPSFQIRLTEVQKEFPYDIATSVLSSKLGKSNLEFALNSLSGYKETTRNAAGIGISTALSGVSVEISHILRSCAIIGTRQQMRTSKNFGPFENEATYKYAVIMASVASLSRVALKRVMGIEMRRNQNGVREVLRKDIAEQSTILGRKDEAIVDAMFALVTDMSTNASLDNIERQYELYADFSNIDCVAVNVISCLTSPVGLTDEAIIANRLRPGVGAVMQLPTWAQLEDDQFINSVSGYSTFIKVLTTRPMSQDGLMDAPTATALITKGIVLDAFHQSVLNGMTNVRGDAKGKQPTLRELESLRLRFFSTFIAKRASAEQRRLILAGVEAINT